MNAMNEFVKPTLVLAIICLVITALLSVSHEITQPIIDENERKTAEIARAEVLTEADSFEQIEGEFPEGVQEVYQAANGTGYTVTVTSKGYSSDPLKVMVGLKEDGTIERIKVLANNETPGLGSKVSNDDFVNQFEGMDSSMENFVAIGGATISSNAMKRAIESAFQVYETVKGE